MARARRRSRVPGRRVETALFRPVTARKAAEAVLDQLVDLIRSGELREGDELPGERVIAASMEVSRPTVRLAMAALVDAGVAEVEQGRGGGARIKSIWIPDGLNGSIEELRIDQSFDVLEARRAIEPRVAQLAALRATDKDFYEMEQSIELQSAHQQDRARALQAEMLFHRLMWRAAGNPALADMLRMLFARLEVILDMALRTTQDRGRAVEIHRDTLTALASGRSAEVEAAMDQHMSYLEQIVEDEYGRKRLREVPAFLTGSGHTR